MNIERLEAALIRHESEKNLIDSSVKNNKAMINKLSLTVDDLIEARNIIAEAARITQLQFKTMVEQLTTSAIQSVFEDDDYKFIVEFTVQNNRPQINLMVQQGDKEPYIPKDEQGGGMMDIISFALRVIMWSLQTNRSRNTLIFDEPFRWTGNLTEQAAVMMKEISKKLGLQIIMVTHDERLMGIADKSWLCKKEKGISITEQVKDNFHEGR